MYCSKCGKKIDYDSPVCRECEEAEKSFSKKFFKDDEFFTNKAESPSENSYPSSPQPSSKQPSTRLEGFGVALTATILGFRALVNFFKYANATSTGLEYLFLMLGIGLAIPALILGIKSIKVYRRVKKQGGVNPIATLVLGIVGLVFGALVLLILAVSFFIAMIIIVGMIGSI